MLYSNPFLFITSPKLLNITTTRQQHVYFDKISLFFEQHSWTIQREQLLVQLSLKIMFKNHVKHEMNTMNNKK